MTIGINWKDVWKPVWKSVWRQSAVPVTPPVQFGSGGGSRGWDEDEWKEKKRFEREVAESLEAVAHEELADTILEPEAPAKRSTSPDDIAKLVLAALPKSAEPKPLTRMRPVRRKKQPAPAVAVEMKGEPSWEFDFDEDELIMIVNALR